MTTNSFYSPKYTQKIYPAIVRHAAGTDRHSITVYTNEAWTDYVNNWRDERHKMLTARLNALCKVEGILDTTSVKIYCGLKDSIVTISGLDDSLTALPGLPGISVSSSGELHQYIMPSAQPDDAMQILRDAISDEICSTINSCKTIDYEAPEFTDIILIDVNQ